MQILTDAVQASRWLRSHMQGELRIDSRRVQVGDAFVAWPGHGVDARRFVPAALRSGAVACLVEQAGVAEFHLPAGDERIAAMPNLKAATGEIASALFSRPGAKLAMVAVTGTNGKSSTAWWTAQALTHLGLRCGVVGTLGIGEPPRLAAGADRPAAGDELGTVRPTGLTTPDPVTLQSGLHAMVEAGLVACAMEASSIGIAEHRLAGTPINIAVLTNFTRDHLDYHGDMAAYWACKRALFSSPGLRAAVINIDDPHGAALAAELRAGALDVWTVSTQIGTAARLAARDVRYVDGGIAFELVEGDAVQPVRSRLIGDYNASNLLGVLGVLRALATPLDHAAQAVRQLSPVPGRMQRVRVSEQALPEVVVDYAHTPDALDKVLQALRPLAAARGGRLWCVFGCGGQRDASKRPLMGAIAQTAADVVVVTSDNPRDESPQAIIEQIIAGMVATASAAMAAPQVMVDRRAAIEHALCAAAPADVVLVAGKGHETTQDIAGIRHPFSDVLVATRALQARATAC